MTSFLMAKGHMIGPYTRVRAEQKGIAFEPEKSGYAGKENPVGIRFQGLVRWATPVVQNGRISGYVTIGANVDEFHRRAIETAETIQRIEARFGEKLELQKKESQALIKSTLQKAFQDLSFYTGIMIVIVIGIAIFMAAVLTKRITRIISGIRRFQQGDRGY